jgi:hypothetical protein
VPTEAVAPHQHSLYSPATAVTGVFHMKLVPLMVTTAFPPSLQSVTV